MAKAIFEISGDSEFESNALAWAQQYDKVCYFQSNGFKDSYSVIESLLAVDASYTFESAGKQTFEDLKKFKTKYANNNWLLGFFGYDLKNEIENLETNFSNPLDFPDAFFFVPKIILNFFNNQVEIESVDPETIFQEIKSFKKSIKTENVTIEIKKRFSSEAYKEAFDNLIQHIKRGDIYEVNLCQEFYSENTTIDALTMYEDLNRISPTPYSTFFKIDHKFILSASPERFLAKRNNILISQPIKGTAPRGKNADEDFQNINNLRNNPKEIAENIMIVDLVRNDLTRTAQPGTVDASRKLEIHSFEQVHQLISTITCVKAQETNDIDVIKNIFPPGSMTGAPKISAMRLCDKYEGARRGVYSGAIGYFAPNGDFDFNVVIRTLLYNQHKKYLSFHTGGAITIEANVDSEYKECFLKAKAILTALQTSLK